MISQDKSTPLAESQQRVRKTRLVGGTALMSCVVATALLCFRDQRTQELDLSETEDFPRSLTLMEDHQTTLGNGWGDISLSKLQESGKCYKIVRERCVAGVADKHCDHFDGRFFVSESLLTEDNSEEDDSDDDDDLGSPGNDQTDCVDRNNDGRCDYTTETLSGCQTSCKLYLRSYITDTRRCGAYLQTKSNGNLECYCVLGSIGECCEGNQQCAGETGQTDNSGAVF